MKPSFGTPWPRGPIHPGAIQPKAEAGRRKKAPKSRNEPTISFRISGGFRRYQLSIDSLQPARGVADP
jgi:hypothetical protein